MKQGFNGSVHPFVFRHLSGHEFERLVFAFLLRRWSWRSLDWFGQSGNDGGRDIIGLRDGDYGQAEQVVVACANWNGLTVKKATSDIAKFCNGSIPSAAIVVAGGKVSSTAKTRIKAFASSKGIDDIQIWSGSEFEEQLRFHAESVATRFSDGNPLPDEPNSLRDFVRVVSPDEPEALRLVGRLFDRPAFVTRFYQESSVPAFYRAVADTIDALNTGIYRNRDGIEIRRIPSRHDFQDGTIRDALAELARRVVTLRSTFDLYRRRQEIRILNDDSDFSMFEASTVAVDDLNSQRYVLLAEVERLTGLSIPHQFDRGKRLT